MPKILLEENVLIASQNRISWTFDNFEKVYLSFSAGKDSTVMYHLVAEEARRRGRKIGVLLVDLEGQYKLTIEHAQEMFKEYSDVTEMYWVCLPIHLRNAVSVYQPFWKCWDNEKKEAWIRELPNGSINNKDFFPFFRDGMEFEEFVPLFGEWYSQGLKTACLVGIRTDESLNRYRTIASTKKIRIDDIQWTSGITENVYNIYPIYDWKTEDIWTYHAKYQNKRFNQLYEYMYKTGLSIHEARICQPYGDDQRKGLWMFQVVEPETWAKVVARVNGANGGANYIKEWGNINGYRKITKPEGHTWESFSKLLLMSMPKRLSNHYQNKIWVFTEWWSKKGYPDGLPDEVDYELEAKHLAPSWRRVCKSLLRNDFWMKGLGFTQHKSRAYRNYLDLMRRRREIKEWIQIS